MRFALCSLCSPFYSLLCSPSFAVITVVPTSDIFNCMYSTQLVEATVDLAESFLLQLDSQKECTELVSGLKKQSWKQKVLRKQGKGKARPTTVTGKYKAEVSALVLFKTLSAAFWRCEWGVLYILACVLIMTHYPRPQSFELMPAEVEARFGGAVSSALLSPTTASAPEDEPRHACACVCVCGPLCVSVYAVAVSPRPV